MCILPLPLNPHLSFGLSTHGYQLLHSFLPARKRLVYTFGYTAFPIFYIREKHTAQSLYFAQSHAYFRSAVVLNAAYFGPLSYQIRIIHAPQISFLSPRTLLYKTATIRTSFGLFPAISYPSYPLLLSKPAEIVLYIVPASYIARTS